MKVKLAILALVILFASGCTKSGLTGPFLGIDEQEIRQIVGDENADIKIEYFYANQVQENIAELNAKCAEPLEIKDYGLITVESVKIHARIFADLETQVPVCIIKEISGTGSCTKDDECDDGLASTSDECDTAIRRCANIRISACTSGDNYCPRTCIKAQDSDCARECFENSQCNDSNALTDDTCYTTTQSCIYVPVPWINDICSTDEDCIDECVCTDESCVEGICKRTNHPNGEICGNYLECYTGVCETWGTHPLTISDVNVSYDNGLPKYPKVVVSWKTNKVADSEVRYGVLPPLQIEVLDYLYAEKAQNKDEVLSHSIELTKFKKETEYLYKAISVSRPHRQGEDREEAVSEASLKIKFKTCEICDDKDECTEDTCDLKKGACLYEPIEGKTGC